MGILSINSLLQRELPGWGFPAQAAGVQASAQHAGLLQGHLSTSHPGSLAPLSLINSMALTAALAPSSRVLINVPIIQWPLKTQSQSLMKSAGDRLKAHMLSQQVVHEQICREGDQVHTPTGLRKHGRPKSSCVCASRTLFVACDPAGFQWLFFK